MITRKVPKHVKLHIIKVMQNHYNITIGYDDDDNINNNNNNNNNNNVWQ